METAVERESGSVKSAILEREMEFYWFGDRGACVFSKFIRGV